MADERRRVNLLLDEMNRLREALLVLHFESDTDLPFNAWVETTRVRIDGHIDRYFTQLENADE